MWRSTFHSHKILTDLPPHDYMFRAEPAPGSHWWTVQRAALCSCELSVSVWHSAEPLCMCCADSCWGLVTEHWRAAAKVFCFSWQEAQNSHVYWVSAFCFTKQLKGRSLFTVASLLCDKLWGRLALVWWLFPSISYGLSTVCSWLQFLLTVFLLSSGATVFAWRTLTVKWYSSENGTGGYLACLAPWKRSGAVGWWEG